MGGGLSDNRSENFGDKGFIELTGKIMVVAIALLFFVVLFVFCLHLYAKRFWYRRQESTTSTTSRRRRGFDFAAAGDQEVTSLPSIRRGLDSSVLKSIPVMLFDPKEFKVGLECAVCLCEVSESQKARLLPKCNHGFHVDCIDMWFQSHSTCPLCRNPVANQSSSGGESPLGTILEAPIGENSGVSVEAPNFPTNVLIWGNETQVSTFNPSVEETHHQGNAIAAEPSSSSMPSSVIDIPRQMNEEEESKTAVPTRLRSLKRLLSGNRRISPSSPRNLDMEQGGSRVQS